MVLNSLPELLFCEFFQVVLGVLSRNSELLHISVSFDT